MNKEVSVAKIRDFRRHKEYKEFDQASNGYSLMPFNFYRVDDTTEVIINEVGDFLYVKKGTAEKIITRKLSKRDEPDLYADLIANFFISEHIYSPNIDILAARIRTKKLFLESFTSLHIFVITLRCDHTCSYCQVSRVTQNRDIFDMKREYLDKGIDFMMKSPNPCVTMEFQGGEALLAFDQIKYAIAKVESLAPIYGKKVSYVICTNLALINEEILEYCKSHQILISASLDGPKEVHDRNRNKLGASSYELAVRGIEMSQNILGKDRVSALMTTTLHSLKYPKEIVDEYFKRDFGGVFLRNISPYGFALRTEEARYQTDEFLDFYKVALDHIIEYNKQGFFFVEHFSQILLTKILTPYNVGFVDMQSPAGLINGVIVFNYNGKVYATDESRMLGEQNDYSFMLGDLVDDTYDEIVYGEKAQKIAQVWANESLAGCSDCPFQVYCGADPVHHWATQGDIYGYRPTSSFCQKSKGVISHLFKLMREDNEAKKILESWVRI